MDNTTVDLYIYYRVEDVAAALPRVRAMQDALADRSGVRGRLMRRHDDDVTLMEIYPDVIDAAVFEALLADEVATHGLESLIAPGAARHTERFVCA
jgi:hypothetical protein